MNEVMKKIRRGKFFLVGMVVRKSGMDGAETLRKARHVRRMVEVVKVGVG